MRFYSLCLLFIFTLQVVAIGEPEYPPLDIVRFPTVASLQNNPIPAADRVALAQRFLGLESLPQIPSNVLTRLVGEQDTFFVTTTSSGQIETVFAELLAVSDHVYVWVEIGTPISIAQAEGFAERFDRDVYDAVRALWGSEDNPGIDGDPHIYALFTVQLSNQIGAYFSSQNLLPQAIQPYSNEHEMLIFNVNTIPRNLTDPRVVSIAIHEFQHMIRSRLDLDETAWMDEGFSMLTEYLLGYDDNSSFMDAFMSRPYVQLNAWGITPHRLSDYGASMLFMLYFHSRYGLEGVTQLSNAPENGMEAVDATLQALGEPPTEVFFADWVLANALRQTDGIYGYDSLPEISTIASRFVTHYPYTDQGMLPPYSTAYYAIANPPDEMTITWTMSDTIGLLPVDAPSGTHVWYSQRGDESNPRLTRAFDLSTVTSAELQFRVWYDLEVDWDYAYVSVSVDEGVTWTILPTDYTTTNNPNGKAYGVGYNGQSGGWLDDSVTLDHFVGQNVLVRFEVVTDDATLFTGIAIDDIRLEALGYISDVENDDGGWQSEGWIRTDNRLPLRAWVQVVQSVNGTVTISRWLAEGTNTWTLPIADDAWVLMAVSPIAPMTTLPVDYAIIID